MFVKGPGHAFILDKHINYNEYKEDGQVVQQTCNLNRHRWADGFFPSVMDLLSIQIRHIDFHFDFVPGRKKPGCSFGNRMLNLWFGTFLKERFEKRHLYLSVNPDDK